MKNIIYNNIHVYIGVAESGHFVTIDVPTSHFGGRNP